MRTIVSRLVPDRPFPPYAYLPGRFPHPTRSPQGHSFGLSLTGYPSPSPALTVKGFRWGIDLFNFGYYWEAHEAWEEVWKSAASPSWQRDLLKGLILLCAAGVKIRESKPAATKRHATRAADMFSRVEKTGVDLSAWIGLSAGELQRHAVHVAAVEMRAPVGAKPAWVFHFVLGQHLLT